MSFDINKSNILITPYGMFKIRGSLCNFRDNCLYRNEIMEVESSDIPNGPIKLFCDHCIKNGRLLKYEKGKTFLVKYMGDFYNPMELPY